MSDPSVSAHAVSRRRWRPLFLLPFLVFAVLAGTLFFGLTRNPKELSSALINKPVPEFALPPLRGQPVGLATADLKGQLSLVNVWASWCIPCREENPLLLGLAREGVARLYGINYKDRPEDAISWLDTYGDPFTLIGADLDGRAGIDWGVYGVPETFVVRADGVIIYKHIGALTAKDVDSKIRPLLANLKQAGSEKP